MLTVTAILPRSLSMDPRDGVNLLTNLDAAGNAAGEIDPGRPTNPAVLPQFPAAEQTNPAYLASPYGAAPYLGEDLAAGNVVHDLGGYLETPYLAVPYGNALATGQLDVAVKVGPVHFGRLKVAFQATDAAGNVQEGTPATREMVVNSTPQPARQFRRVGLDDDGRLWFSFLKSPQL